MGTVSTNKVNRKDPTMTWDTQKWPEQTAGNTISYKSKRTMVFSHIK